MTTIQIRQAEPIADDLVPVITHGREMHKNSTLRNLQYDPRQLGDTLLNLAASEHGAVILAEADGEVVGFVLALVSKSFFGPDLVASELAVYVTPEYRGTRAGVKLVRAYVAWAKSRGAKRINSGNSAGMDDQKYLKLLTFAGFQPAGSLVYQDIA